MRVALKRGSVWRERFTGTSAMAGIRFEEYGALSDPLPKIDCADVLTNDGFTATSGTTKVYQITVSVETDAFAAEWPGLWVNGTRMTYVANTAACEARASTFTYTPNPATDAGTITLYVHPPGSTNPVSDGKTYEAAVRKTGLDFGFCPYAEVENVHGTRNYSSYGSMLLGRWNRARGCRTSEGNTHNLFVRANCEVEDHLADGWHANGQGGHDLHRLRYER